LYIITKPPNKLKTTPNAVDLAMNLLLSTEARKHSGESTYYHQFKTTELSPTLQSPIKMLKISP